MFARTNYRQRYAFFGLALASLIAAGSLRAQQPVPNPVSVVISSDPQFNWWRYGLDPTCKDPTCRELMTKTHVSAIVQAMNNTGALQWPSGLASLAAADRGKNVPQPSGAIFNGDLTQYWQPNEYDLYRQYVPGLIRIPLYPGLGNHDYANNKGDCMYNTLDSNGCAKQAMGYMADVIAGGLPGLVNSDVPASVGVLNSGGYLTRFSVTYDGLATPLQSPAFSALDGWQSFIVPKSAANLTVTIEGNFNAGWHNIGTYHQAAAGRYCYGTAGTVFSGQTSVAMPCFHSLPKDGHASLSYSFDIGNVHFVQLQLSPDWAYTYFAGSDIHGEPIPQFTVDKSWDWLKNDLHAATAKGQYSVLNMHAFGGFTNEQGDTLSDSVQLLGDFPTSKAHLVEALSGNNVIAIFAGHLHDRFGFSGSINVPGLPLLIDDKPAVPVFLSGSGSAAHTWWPSSPATISTWARCSLMAVLPCGPSQQTSATSTSRSIATTRERTALRGPSRSVAP